MRFPKLTLLLLPLAPISLTACGTDLHSSPAVYNQCDSIHLPAKLNAVQRAQLADELDSAAPHAVWPNVLGGADRVYDEVIACQGVRP